MKIIVVQTYPVYHDLIDTIKWLKRINRDRWIPGILSDFGHVVELWAGDKHSDVYRSDLDGFGRYKIRLFSVEKQEGPSKKHISNSLLEYAKSHRADLYILKGTDGGIGIHLLKNHLIPNHIPFVFIIGGKYYTRDVPKANLILYETGRQKKALQRPGMLFWRKSIPEDKLIRLPKSVDTSIFTPDESVTPKWDLVVVGRLIGRYKNYDALGELSEQLSIGVVGGGPAKEKLEKKYPGIEWVGQVPNRYVARYLNMGKAFFHPGNKDFFPRVIAEAAACGCALIGFKDALGKEVIPEGCGIRVSKREYVNEIKRLCENQELLKEMGENARKNAILNFHKYSTAPALNEMMFRLAEENIGFADQTYQLAEEYTRSKIQP